MQLAENVTKTNYLLGPLLLLASGTL